MIAALCVFLASSCDDGSDTQLGAGRGVAALSAGTSDAGADGGEIAAPSSGDDEAEPDGSTDSAMPSAPDDEGPLFSRTAAGVELATVDPTIRLVMEAGAIYLVRGDERFLVLEPAYFERGRTRGPDLPTGALVERGRRVVVPRGPRAEE